MPIVTYTPWILLAGNRGVAPWILDLLQEAEAEIVAQLDDDRCNLGAPPLRELTAADNHHWSEAIMRRNFARDGHIHSEAAMRRLGSDLCD